MYELRSYIYIYIYITLSLLVKSRISKSYIYHSLRMVLHNSALASKLVFTKDVGYSYYIYIYIMYELYVTVPWVVGTHLLINNQNHLYSTCNTLIENGTRLIQLTLYHLYSKSSIHFLVPNLLREFHENPTSHHYHWAGCAGRVPKCTFHIKKY